MPRDLRTSYYFGLGSILVVVNMVVVAIVFAVAATLPPVVAAGLFLLTPMYFLTSLWGSAREQAAHIAMVLGLVLGPLLHLFAPGFDLLGRRADRRRSRLRCASRAGPAGMTLDSIDAWWWPYAFILLAGWATTYPWRALGVYLGGRIREDAEILVLVRAIATALVAAVIGNLVCFPSGPAANTTLALRVLAAAVGFAAYFFLGRKVLLGIVVAEAIFGLGFYLGY